ncbi:unnamed protein product [Didymodactylos carnosus]|uniref:ABC transporter domain-containing protein n=1 Tax=Didymodactylos carnosus TaxID=1234261 RepID=A0A8S2FBC9_9BILA|nr:unnamed protein product [Didymodactylos carnosus]CAF4214181.1 unnamed protein product [Didymodactylos carnosus]
MFLFTIMPYLQSVGEALAAASEIWQIIDEVSENKSKTSESDTEETIKNLLGDIEFDNVHFSYPTRSEIKALSGLSFTALKGETTALVGNSGCGKSTCFQLLLGFYQPTLGAIRINRRSIDQYNLKWLRQSIGIVGQEPILFATTIFENIKYGCKDDKKNDVTMNEIVEAAKKANAHEFIMQLPNVTWF